MQKEFQEHIVLYSKRTNSSTHTHIRLCILIIAMQKNFLQEHIVLYNKGTYCSTYVCVFFERASLVRYKRILL